MEKYMIHRTNKVKRDAVTGRKVMGENPLNKRNPTREEMDDYFGNPD